MLVANMCSQVLMILMLLTFLITVQGRHYLEQKPDFFKNCSSKEPDFNQCYKDNLQALLSEFKDGIPGLGANGVFEPLKIKKLKITQQQLKLELSNITIRGISATNLTRIKQNPKDFSFRVRARVPELRVSARYRIDGHLLFLPITGHGDLRLQAKNVSIALMFKMRLQDDGNYTYADAQAVRTQIRSIGDFQVLLDDLFNGNKALEQYANTFLNGMWHEIVEVLRPTLQSTLDAIILARFKAIFNYIPANYFIADVPTAAELYDVDSRRMNIRLE